MARVLVRVYHFNSCLREETNVYDKFMYDLRQLFQLTSLQRDEQVLSPFVYILLYFNSRLRKETNQMMTVHRLKVAYFNSRLRKETNIKFHCHLRQIEISTHVSARRRTLVFYLITFYLTYFNSRLRKGTNIKQFLYSYHFCYFNSRLREETNPAEPTTSFSTKLISNHVSVRRRTSLLLCFFLFLIFQLTSP